jgi:hypothetical protein
MIKKQKEKELDLNTQLEKPTLVPSAASGGL